MKNLIKKLLSAALIFTQVAPIQAAEVVTDVLRLKPATVPGTGVNGQLRVDSSDDKLKKYSSTRAVSRSRGSGIGVSRPAVCI